MGLSRILGDNLTQKIVLQTYPIRNIFDEEFKENLGAQYLFYDQATTSSSMKF